MGNLPLDQQLHLAIPIIAALSASVFTAVLAFGIRYYLDARAQRISERRLAHVFLHDVTDICAAGRYLARLVKLTFPLRDDALSSDTFDVSHAVAVVVADGVRALPDEARRKLETQVPVLNALIATSRFEPSPEQLSKMPRGVVSATREYQQQFTYAVLLLRRWMDFVVSGDSEWVTATIVKQHWTGFRFMYLAALSLRNELIRHGAATQKEADAMLASAEVTALLKWALDVVDQRKLAAAYAKYGDASSSHPSDSGAEN